MLNKNIRINGPSNINSKMTRIMQQTYILRVIKGKKKDSTTVHSKNFT